MPAFARSTIALAGYCSPRRPAEAGNRDSRARRISDSRRSTHKASARAFIWIALAVLVILFSARTAISYYVDSLWFSSLGYSEVFWRTLQFKWTAFAIPFVLTFLILYGWFAVLRRGCREELHNAGTIVLGNRTFELPVDPVLRVGALIASAFVALLAGASFMSEWSRFVLYWFAGSSTTGVHDPIFGKSLGFYFFTLPALQFVFGWLLMLAICGCAIAGLFLVLTGSSQLFKDHTYGISTLPWRALSAAFAFLLIVVAMRTWLGRFDRILADYTIFGGVTYTDDHLILVGALVIGAALILGRRHSRKQCHTSPAHESPHRCPGAGGALFPCDPSSAPGI